MINVVVDDTRTRATFRLLNRRLGAPHDFLTGDARPYLLERIRSRFGSQGDDASGKWLALTIATRAIRASLGYGASSPINIRTGQMLQHLLSNYSITAGGTTLNVPGNTGGREMRAKLETAQRGRSSSAGTRMPGPSRPTPPRPVLALNHRDADALTTLFGHYLMSATP